MAVSVPIFMHIFDADWTDVDYDYRERAKNSPRTGQSFSIRQAEKKFLVYHAVKQVFMFALMSQLLPITFPVDLQNGVLKCQVWIKKFPKMANIFYRETFFRSSLETAQKRADLNFI